MPKPALGRGLEALLKSKVQLPSVAAKPDQSATPDFTRSREGTIQFIPIDRIRQSPFQPRKDFPEEALRELAESIRAHGVMQPILVRSKGEFYELIAGERRWRAAQMSGMQTIPAIVHEMDDKTALEISLVENLQRQDLNPIEEALGYSVLVEQFNLSQEEVAQRVGKSRVAIANALRLLKLPHLIQEYLRTGKITAGHARAILSLEDQTLQIQLANRIVDENLSVRQAERLATALSSGKKSRRKSATPTTKSPHIQIIETKLRQHFGTRVDLHYSAGIGMVQIHFFNDEDLTRILQLMGLQLE